MDKNIRIAVILSAVDRMSSIIAGSVSKSQQKLRELSSKSFDFGKTALIGAAALGATLAAPIAAFSDLEDAGLRLKSVLMQDGGIVPEKAFSALNQQAISLGNKLPGTTADFQNLYATMLEQGTPANAILAGTGKAAAYLAVQLKMPTEQAGILASRLRLQMGIADNEMMKFMDIMARIKNVGVDPAEMQYAFGRSAGVMKLLNVQGLQATKTLGSLYAMLIREGGATGETAGTGISKILNEIMNPVKMAKFNIAAKSMGLSFEFFRKGKFLGMENFVAQMTKFQNMDPEKISKVLMPLTGGEGMDNQFIASLSKMGADGFNKMSASLANQATLQSKVEIQLDSLTNKWEAAKGTFTNSIAAFAGTFAPVLKNWSDLFNTVSVKMQAFIEKHPVLTKYVGLLILTATVLLTVLGGLGFLIGGMITTWANLSLAFRGLGIAARFLGIGLETMAYSMLRSVIPAITSFTASVWANTAAMLANPTTWIIMAIVAAVALLSGAAYLLYKNWTPITNWFSNQWTIIKAQVSGAIAVFTLFQDVIVGVGKSLVGAFTFNPKMFTDGVIQANSAVDKIMNGGISKSYDAAYNKVMQANMQAKIAAAPLSRTSPLGKPLMQPNFLKPLGEPVRKTVPVTNNHFAPVINLQGGATVDDGKKLADTLKPHWEKWQRDNNRNQRMTKY